MRVHPSNAAALRSWDGDDGAYWVEHDEIFDRTLAHYDASLLAAVRPGDRVLDLGCGTGSITRAAARRADLAVGIDLSSAMLAVARRKATAEGCGSSSKATVRFVHGDAQVHDFAAGSFDVAVSRAGVMFFGDPVAAFANVAGALRAGGRLAVLVWQPLEANEWMVALLRTLNGGAPPSQREGPFSLADPDRVRAALAGPDPGVEARLRALLGAHTGPDGVHFGSALWLVTAHRPERAGPRTVSSAR